MTCGSLWVIEELPKENSYKASKPLLSFASDFGQNAKPESHHVAT
jgi:hypothetical protein